MISIPLLTDLLFVRDYTPWNHHKTSQVYVLMYICVCMCIYMYIRKEAIPKENQSSQLTPPVVTRKAWRWEDVNKPHIPQETMGISM